MTLKPLRRQASRGTPPGSLRNHRLIDLNEPVPSDLLDTAHALQAVVGLQQPHHPLKAIVLPGGSNGTRVAYSADPGAWRSTSAV